MGKIDLARAKLHLRIYADVTEEDPLIESWIVAAYLAIEGKIFRKVYDEFDIPVDDPTGIVADEAINAAAQLIIGHLYANREAVTATQAVEMPMGAQWLLFPYIHTGGGF